MWHVPSSNLSSVCLHVPCVQATALQHLANYLGLVVRLATQAGEIDATPTKSWPACVGSSGSSQPSRMAANMPTQAGMVVQQVKGLFCLRDLFGTAMRYLSAADQPRGQDSALLEHLASALVQQSGLASSQQPQQQQGYTSRGLLHHILSLHVHAVLKGAAASGLPLYVHMAVNALHLTRHVFGQLLPPGLPAESAPQQQCAQQLLLPCMAYPLLDVLAANPGECGRVQLHAYRLLQQLLCGAVGRQLLPSERPQQLAPAGLAFG